MNSGSVKQTVVCEFLSEPNRRYLFGATPYASGIAKTISVKAIIDDVIADSHYCGIPVIRTSETPEDALVIVTNLGRPHTARRHLDEKGLQNCDFFTFHRFSGLDLPYARFWTGFGEDAQKHYIELKRVRGCLVDTLSRDTFDRILKFRTSANLTHINTFRENQDNQYFEEFLNLNMADESFADVGSFDGRTTSEFIARCPLFNAVHIFEPDPRNLSTISGQFKNTNRIHFHAVALGDENGMTRFSSCGSTSSVSADGDIDVSIRTLDSFGIEELTLLKMDVEGAELAAIRGAKDTIRRNHPRLAICVYHNPCDLWRIPTEILALREDYAVYLRHYTEGVTETVMFFLPKK